MLQPTISLAEAVASAALVGRVSFRDYMDFASWLGVYEYQMPADRLCYKELLLTILALTPERDLPLAMTSIRMILESLRKEQQHNILEWVKWTTSQKQAKSLQ